uniref:Uncharacterized protein n=1 Tax=Mus spicilegus TaxID=10103 RepID=A0A8C6N0Q9_MUSSI
MEIIMLNSAKLKNLDEINNFLDRFQVPKLTYHINNLNNPIFPKEIEAVINTSLTKKKPRTRWV